MLQLLTGTRLAQNLFEQLVRPTEQDRTERAAWILESGELGPVRLGQLQSVRVAARPQGTVVGYVHTHPCLPVFLNPPSAGAGDSDYDSTLKEFPIQFVVESARGRVWGQFPPRHAALLGWVNAPRSFQPLADTEGLARKVYKIVPIDSWRLQQDQRAGEDLAREREQLRQRLLQQQQRAGQKPK
jgi:hypothetical protein